MSETNANTNIEDFNGLASRVGSLLGLLENIIGGNQGEIPAEDAELLEDGNPIAVGNENPESPSANAEGEVEVDPMEQIRADIALLRKQVGTVDQLQAQIAALPRKDEIVASVLSRIPAPKCSCQKETGAAAEARDPDCLAGIGPC